MKKLFKTALKVVGVLLLLLLLTGAYFYYTASNYSTYPLKADKERFPEVKTDKDIEVLAKRMVAEMNLEEKIDQFYGDKWLTGWNKMVINLLVNKRFPHVYVGRNERLGIPPFVLSDGPRGARVLGEDINAVTVFPVAMARGASWDVDLERRVHEVIATEMRVNGTNYGATPCINLLRHPAWGRAQESYGEDPWHLGQFGIAAVQGLQNHNVMACPKHFALNSVENSRTVIDVKVDERTLREVYLPHFKKVVQEGRPASMMSAYNSVQGAYMSDNKHLLMDILRDEWGFEGFVSSDWIFGTHDAVKSIKAGMDIEMPVQDIYAYDKVRKALKVGEITEEEINDQVIRILRTRLQYAFADDRMDYDQSLLLQESHVDLAREAAEKSMVLVKNEQVLPFSSASGQKVVVIGRLADQENTGDHGSSDCRPPYVVTPLEGIKNYHASLGNEVAYFDGTNVQEALEAAKNADQVILLVGYSAEDEGEYILIGDPSAIEKSAVAGKQVGKKGIGGDRKSLKLLPDDQMLIEKLAGSNEQLAVVYVGGSAINVTDWYEQVPAILFAWYGGMEGGNALANILYGQANPSGKLPFSIARNESDYPYFTPFAKEIEYGYYHGYTLFDKNEKEVVYPFGHGLSYTQFTYDSLIIEKPDLTANDTLKVSAVIQNIGSVAGEEVTQLYIGFANSKVDRPVKLLRGFSKVQLQPGESRRVEFNLDLADLKWYNDVANQWELEDMTYEVYVGNSSAEDRLLRGQFEIK